ncbi:MAG: hypothetical protein ACPIOQ_14045 [Promethearchaeia archaeon]
MPADGVVQLGRRTRQHSQDEMYEHMAELSQKNCKINQDNTSHEHHLIAEDGGPWFDAEELQHALAHAWSLLRWIFSLMGWIFSLMGWESWIFSHAHRVLACPLMEVNGSAPRTSIRPRTHGR